MWSSPVCPWHKQVYEQDQDGGVGGCGAHLPPQTHQKYIKTCGTIPMKNELETGRRTSMQTNL